MSDVKELIKQRGHIKARVTLFEKYLKPLLECKEISLVQQSFKIQEQSDNNSKNLPTLSPAATAATDSEVPSSSASVSMTAISTNQSLLSTALVKVTSNGKTCILRALLDCGSQSSFVTVRALRETGSQHFDSDYHSVSGIGSSVFNVTKHCYLDIGSLNSSLVMRVKCFVLPHITDRLPNVAVNVQHLDIPCHVQLADPKFFEPSDIDLLLGADVFWDLLESSRINLGPQGPILQETKLGWIVAGPTAIHSNNKNQHTSLGALGDSFYEYLLKAWILSDNEDVQAREMFDEAMQAALDKMLRTSPSGLAYLAEVKYGRIFEEKMDHLSCFAGGMFALASTTMSNSLSERYMDVARKLTHTCHESYDRSETKLGPEAFRFSGAVEARAMKSNEKMYLLRPETFESYFIMWRLTKDQKYRDWGLGGGSGTH
ncbi:unnamed protein product [Danaus chrysippus]|uniref:alpha-1,2-Mannosidase n=1 Tax=Danaus chrysippus TaxID=151541 RepID=A0A8J2MEE0_9NEOP|nr:unnamed protein product [Danaus chrysippus]